jgi:hypothetical protein
MASSNSASDANVCRAVVSDGFLVRLPKDQGRVVLTAIRASEVGERREALGHGVFTTTCEGLQGKADLEGGWRHHGG